MNSPSDKLKIDMSLRLWSEQVPLQSIINTLDVTPGHLHVAGEPMARDGRLAERHASRHYASLDNAYAASDADVCAWCRSVIIKIESHESLVGFLHTGNITATLWIAVFGTKSSPMPNLSKDIIERASQLNLSVLLENYTDLTEGGVPKKLWVVKDQLQAGSGSDQCPK
jgi:hypothetical protein